MTDALPPDNAYYDDIASGRKGAGMKNITRLRSSSPVRLRHYRGGSNCPGLSPNRQYSLGILGLWLLAAAPMGLLAGRLPTGGRVNMHQDCCVGLMIAGLMWQALSLIILYRETGTLNLDAIRHRTWRQRPRDPITGQPRARLWLWLPVFAVLVAVVEFVVSPLLGEAWTAALPFLAEPAGYSLEILLDTPAQWVGAWYLLGLWLLQFVGNYLLGEEFLFRSVLLPKMEGVFGRWDWLERGAVRLYHLHGPGTPLVHHHGHPLHLSQPTLSQCVVRRDPAWSGRRFLPVHDARPGAGPDIAKRGCTPSQPVPER